MGSICGRPKKNSIEIVRSATQSSFYRYFNNISPTQIKLLSRIYQDLQPIHMENFASLFPNFPDPPDLVVRSLFLQYDLESSLTITFQNICCIVSKYTMGSRRDKLDFIYKVLQDTLPEHCSNYLKNGSSIFKLPIPKDKFIDWGLQHMYVNDAYQPFEIIPSPTSEKRIILEKFANKQTLEVGKAFNLISKQWITAWRQYVYEDTPSEFNRTNSILPGARPIEIDNSILCDLRQRDKLRDDVQEDIDFEIIPPEAWKELVKWYGGGPELLRFAINGPKLELWPAILHVKWKNNKRVFDKTVNLSVRSYICDVIHKIIGFYHSEWVLYSVEKSLWKPLDPDRTIEDLDLSETSQLVLTRDSLPTEGEFSSDLFSVGECVEYYENKVWVPLTVVETTEKEYVLNARWINKQIKVPKSQPHLLRKQSRILLPPKNDHFSKGLSNLGNTCYLNSILQCLLRTPLLYSYFSEDSYLKDVNKGKNAKITKEVGTLLKQMRTGSLPWYRPDKFLGEFSNLHRDFRGFNQQDAHEFLRFLLDILHEDLNRNEDNNNNKQINVLSLRNPSPSEEKQASEDIWQEIQGKIGSVISDLCGGQTKRTIMCKQCRQHKTVFEIFMDLSLPIPVNDSEFPINLSFVSKKYNQVLRMKWRISKEIDEFYSKIEKEFGVNLEDVVFGFVKNNRLISVINNPTGIQDYFSLETEDVCAFEINIEETTSHTTDKLLPFKVSQVIEYRSPGVGWETVYIEELRDNCAVVNTRQEEVIISPDDSSKIAKYGTHTSPRDGMFHIPINHIKFGKKGIAFFGLPVILSMKYWHTWKEVLRQVLTICNAFSYKESPKLKIILLWKNNFKCALCENSKCQGCDFPSKKEPVLWLFDNKDLVFIAIIWSSYEDYVYIKSIEKEDLRTFDLNDCFNEFTKEESIQLTCEKCNEKEHITRTEVWKVPDVLIVHLKRFQFMINNFYKIKNLVNFPLFSLDMNSYMLSGEKSLGMTIENARENCLYDLFAVVNHSGSVYQGHYTSMCYDENNDTWLEYDDERVFKVVGDSEEEIISSKAYILFYKRKRFNSSSLINLSSII